MLYTLLHLLLAVQSPKNTLSDVLITEVESELNHWTWRIGSAVAVGSSLVVDTFKPHPVTQDDDAPLKLSLLSGRQTGVNTLKIKWSNTDDYWWLIIIYLVSIVPSTCTSARSPLFGSRKMLDALNILNIKYLYYNFHHYQNILCSWRRVLYWQVMET